MTVEEIYMAILSSVGLVCNAVSLSFFIKKRRELGNLLLSYLNIADMIVNFTVFLYLIAPALQNVFTSIVLITISDHVFRSSILVTGLITIYLNILRTSAIVWPLVRFKKRPLHTSLVVLMMVFLVIEVFLGVLHTYPYLIHLQKNRIEIITLPPSTKDNPLAQFYDMELAIIGTPIIFLVTFGCIVSVAKLLGPNKTLRGVNDNGIRLHSAKTVLILSTQYVVCNAVALTFISLYVHYNLHGGRTNKHLMKLYGCGALTLVLNSVLNPIVYVCRVKMLRQHFIGVARCACLKYS